MAVFMYGWMCIWYGTYECIYVRMYVWMYVQSSIAYSTYCGHS